jgi:hypothetical protein
MNGTATREGDSYVPCWDEVRERYGPVQDPA